jgi:adenosylhomocysteinase
LKGVSLLNNTPLSLEILIKVDCLIAAGAKVTLTPTLFVKPHTANNTYNYISKMDLHFIFNHDNLNPFKNNFDFVFDFGVT